jgi:hypothetical protein
MNPRIPKHNEEAACSENAMRRPCQVSAEQSKQGIVDDRATMRRHEAATAQR